MKKHIKFIAVVTIAAAAAVLVGCNKEDSFLTGNSTGVCTYYQNTTTSRTNDAYVNCPEDDAIVLGDTINDPYRLENMQRAYDNIHDGNAPISSVQANFRYVRILPESQEELDAIERDTTIVLFDYPLHYKIAAWGSYYHDPSVNDSILTWLYSVVPINYEFPSGLNEELIYYVYIPPTEAKGDFYYLLEEEAYRVVGYKEDEDEEKAIMTTWIPSALIKGWDDVANRQVPIEGVKVIANYITKIGTGITDENGFCEINKNFIHKVHYRIKWESGFWDIRNGILGQAYYDGPTQKRAWNLEIAKNGKSILYATVHKAAYKFFYGNRLGLRRPNLSYGKTKISVYDRSAWWGTGCCWGTWSLLGIIPDINIAHPHTTNTDFVFGTAIHELGHQSHLLFIGKGTYIQLAKEIHESWAAAIEWRLTNHFYNSELGISYNYPYNYQGWHPGNKGNGKTSYYTPIFIDLMENYNQIILGSNYPNDAISGYNILYIQNNIITNAYGLSSLHTALKNHKINGVTDIQIDNLMALYWNQTYIR
ncbi:MAG: hypothetical protein HUK16_01460 [Bacteroidales bacterium]|nr:hypothetical protein [Bacteroidales bacterium]